MYTELGRGGGGANEHFTLEQAGLENQQQTCLVPRN